MQRRNLLLAVAALGAAAARPEPARRVVIRRGDATIEYTDRGSGPAIVMIASLGRGAEDFDDLAARVAGAGFRVLCPEPRGVGRSEGPLADPTLHDFAADVAAVIDQAGLPGVVALGHAYGNTVARTLAADRPDRVRGVILVAASGRWPFSDEIKLAIAKSSDLSLPDAERLGYLARGYFAPGSDASVWLPGWHPRAQAMQWQAVSKTKLDDYITAGGKVPILDLQGDSDVIIPSEHSQDLHRELGDRVTVVVLKGAGHAMLPEQPGAIADAITTWMRRL